MRKEGAYLLASFVLCHSGNAANDVAQAGHVIINISSHHSFMYE